MATTLMTMGHKSDLAADLRLDLTAGGLEQRGTRRQRMLKEAKVVLADWATIDCSIRDLSSTGARLVFGGPTPLPESFEVLMVSAEKLIPAELVWQRGLAAGVHFTGPERNAPPRKWWTTRD